MSMENFVIDSNNHSLKEVGNKIRQVYCFSFYYITELSP